MFKQESDDFEFLFRKNGYPNEKKKKTQIRQTSGSLHRYIRTIYIYCKKIFFFL